LSKQQTWERKQEQFAKVRALILRIVNSDGRGATIEGISKKFLLRYGFLPRIDNRIRELRKLGYVKTVKEDDGLLHVYPVEDSP